MTTLLASASSPHIIAFFKLKFSTTRSTFSFARIYLLQTFKSFRCSSFASTAQLNCVRTSFQALPPNLAIHQVWCSSSSNGVRTKTSFKQPQCFSPPTASRRSLQLLTFLACFGSASFLLVHPKLLLLSSMWRVRPNTAPIYQLQIFASLITFSSNCCSLELFTS